MRSQVAITDLAPQSQVTKMAQAKRFNLTEQYSMPGGMWLLYRTPDVDARREAYAAAKRVNDDLEDERLELEANLCNLRLSDKETLKQRRRLKKVNKLKQLAHKAMSDAWQAVKEAHDGD